MNKTIKPDTVHDHIEDTIFDSGLPVNSLAMLNRLSELIQQNKTNSLLSNKCRDDPRIKRLMWLINSQFYDQTDIINMEILWQTLKKECSVEY